MPSTNSLQFALSPANVLEVCADVAMYSPPPYFTTSFTLYLIPVAQAVLYSTPGLNESHFAWSASNPLDAEAFDVWCVLQT